MSSRRAELVLAALILVVALAVGHHQALEAPSERVGYRACARLMFRLVDCLIDACELQLEALRLQRQLSPGIVDWLPAEQTAPPTTVSGQLGPGVDLRAPLATNDSSASDQSGPVLSQQHDRLMGAVRPSMRDAGGKLVAPVSPTTTTNIDSKAGALVDILERGDEEQLIEYLRSTRPMNWFRAPPESERASTARPAAAPEQPQQSPPPPHVAQLECWREAIKWLRQRLLAVRMRLLTCSTGDQGGSGSSGSGNLPRRSGGCLAETLLDLSEIQQQLERACEGLDPSSSSSSDERTLPAAMQHKLSYIIESVEVLGELRADALAKHQRRGPGTGSGSELGGERRATDAIKRHYAYLTQIVSAFSLIFEDQDQEAGYQQYYELGDDDQDDDGAADLGGGEKSKTTAASSQAMAQLGGRLRAVGEQSARLRRQVDLHAARLLGGL